MLELTALPELPIDDQIRGAGSDHRPVLQREISSLRRSAVSEGWSRSKHGGRARSPPTINVASSVRPETPGVPVPDTPGVPVPGTTACASRRL
jgi:hypothetical protein